MVSWYGVDIACQGNNELLAELRAFSTYSGMSIEWRDSSHDYRFMRQFNFHLYQKGFCSFKSSESLTVTLDVDIFENLSADTEHDSSVYIRTHCYLHVSILTYSLTANILWSHFNIITSAHRPGNLSTKYSAGWGYAFVYPTRSF